MNRHRFKFWNKRLGKMSKVHGLGVIYEYLCQEWGVCDWNEIVTLQSTGLSDKTGEEIFEGDIIKLHNYVGGRHDAHEVRFGYYHMHHYGFYLYDLNWKQEHTMSRGGEIIGNAMENGELLCQ